MWSIKHVNKHAYHIKSRLVIDIKLYKLYSLHPPYLNALKCQQSRYITYQHSLAR